MAAPTAVNGDLPEHVAIIMDGNGRWAQKRLLPRIEGHRQGAKSVRRAVEFSRRKGIHVLTLYAFSTENWRRPETEVSGLMKLLSQFVDSELKEIHANDIRLNTIGDLSRLPQSLRAKIDVALNKTMNNKAMVLNIALSYGGRQDILTAAINVGLGLKAGTVKEAEIDEAFFSQFLATKCLPDPDLLIRTGGEFRISNFLLWQSAYAELYFTDVLWPDFDDGVFQQAINAYRTRQRRYGMTAEQRPVDGKAG